ncbi:hypothetical protein ABZZ20_02775 [Streptomyces sp. NPDC006430]|uniref:hypothetical protein n=1 Tax=Streptomyces sp. NPDC006430 TaxID=3154299 RepID=UPI0033B8875C
MRTTGSAAAEPDGRGLPEGTYVGRGAPVGNAEGDTAPDPPGAGPSSGEQAAAPSAIAIAIATTATSITLLRRLPMTRPLSPCGFAPSRVQTTDTAPSVAVLR